MGETSLDTKTFSGIKLLCPDSALATAKITINLHNNDPFSTPACYSPTQASPGPLFIFKFHFSPPTFITPLLITLPFQKTGTQKYGFTVWKKSVTEMQWQSNWGQTGGKPGANWGQPKMRYCTALNEWIEGWAVLGGFLRSVEFQICAILPHP